MSLVAVLGPQRLVPTVGEVLRQLEISGPIAVVTAGWQEREGEDEELREHLGVPIRNLELYRRAGELFDDDSELRAAHRERQERLKELQELYRIRLGHALRAARELLAKSGKEPLLEQERSAAIAAVKRLDREHLMRIASVHAAFRAQTRPFDRSHVARHRDELADLLDGCAGVAIAGGHVIVLLNRLRLFGVLELAVDRPVVAWSAGAMALAPRVVVFHDHPPQGAGNAEAVEVGLEACPGVLPLPHARRRLRLHDRRRIGLLSRRFAPLHALPLDEGGQLFWNGRFWWSPEPIRVLDEDGTVRSETGRLTPAHAS